MQAPRQHGGVRFRRRAISEAFIGDRIASQVTHLDVVAHRALARRELRQELRDGVEERCDEEFSKVDLHTRNDDRRADRSKCMAK